MNRNLFYYLALLLLLGALLSACKSSDDTTLQTSTSDASSSDVPDVSADALSFTDSDPKPGYLAGEIGIDAAEDESEVDSYVLYWGSSATEKLSDVEAIATKDKVGANLTYQLTSTATPSGAAYFLVYTANENGEAQTPTSTAITDDTSGAVSTENRFGYAVFGQGVFGP